MNGRGLGFHLFLDLCPSDTANTVIVDKVVQDDAGYEGVGVGRSAIADGAHMARGLIQPDTCNTVANGREAVGITKKTSVDQAHVVSASGTYHSTPTMRISQSLILTLIP